MEGWTLEKPNPYTRDKTPRDDYDVEIMVLRIRDGETSLRDPLIVQSMPFIRSRVMRILGSRQVDDTDELSVAIMAFNESIDQYKAYEPGSFLRFAATVINRRIIDHQRRMKRQTRALPFSSVEFEDGLPFEESRYAASRTDFVGDIEIEEEIALFENRLASFGLKVEDMHRETPKHADSRILCVAAARRILSEPALVTSLYASRRLPVAELALRTGLHRKTIEKNRRFIILLVLLLDSELEVIKSYIESFYGQGAKGGSRP